MDDLICEKCGNKFPFYKNKGRPLPRFCSNKCRGHTGFRPGAPLLISEMSDEEKFERLKKSFEKHVIRKEGCWDWKGPISNNGYPVMSCRRGIGPDRGHKASYVIHKGPVPQFMHVCHTCDNRRCTNPDHLWIGTHKENNDDKMRKGRANCPAPPLKVGSENGSAKLDEIKVKQIKILIKNGRSSYSIGKEFGVSKTTIRRIKNGINWSHVTIEEDK